MTTETLRHCVKMTVSTVTVIDFERRIIMDWDQLSKEAIHHLQDYLRIETVNPPGK